MRDEALSTKALKTNGIYINYALPINLRNRPFEFYGITPATADANLQQCTQGTMCTRPMNGDCGDARQEKII